MTGSAVTPTGAASRRMRLRTRLCLVVLGAWTALLLLVGTTILVFVAGDLRDRAAGDLVRITVLLAQDLDRFFAERRGDVRVLARMEATTSSNPTAIADALRLARDSYQVYQHLRVVDRRGIVIADTNQLDLGRTDPQVASYPTGGTWPTSDTGVMRLERTGRDDRAVARFIHPIGSGQALRGWVIAVVPLARLSDRLKDPRITIDGMRVEIYDSRGEQLVSSDGLSGHHELQSRIHDRPTVVDDDEHLLVQMGRHPDDLGDGWNLNVSISHDRLQQTVTRVLLVLIALLVGSILVGGVVIWWIADGLTHPLARLADQVRRLSGKGWTHHRSLEALPNATAEVVQVQQTIDELTHDLRSQFMDLIDFRERLELATKGAGIGVWDWDVPANRLAWDQSMYEVYGIESSEFAEAYDAWKSRVMVEDQPRVERNIAEALAGTVPYNTTFRINHRALGVRVIAASGTVHRDGAGKPLRMVGINWDVTDRVEPMRKLELATAELAEKAQQLELSMTAGGVALWDWRIQEGSLALNRIWLERLGYREGELANHLSTWQERVHPDDRARVLAAVEAHLTDPLVPYRCEYRLVHRDGTVRWVSDGGQVVERDEHGRPRRVIGANIDITSLKETEASLHLAREEAEAAMRAKSEFLATMSHEIRTPMNGVIGMASVLLDAQLSHDQRDAVLTIQRSGQALLAILNDILDLSKIEAGRLELERIPFDARQAVRDVLSLLRTQAEDKQLALVLDWPAAVPALLTGDPTRFRQVVLNLLANAVKFTHQGGVHLAASTLSPTARAPHGWLRLAVRDSGIGIPSERIDRLFQRFSQVDASTTRKYGGTGLGLAICQRLCDLMGGAITVSSALGQGSTFTIELPLPGPETRLADHHTEVIIKAISARPLRVLVAEDNLVNQKVARAILSRLDCSVEVVGDGLEALAAWELERYDGIFMDCQMPNLDGYGATRAIRDREQAAGRSRIPIYALTANAFDSDREACREAGMDGLIPKPITQASLTGALQAMRGRRGAEG